MRPRATSAISVLVAMPSCLAASVWDRSRGTISRSKIAATVMIGTIGRAWQHALAAPLWSLCAPRAVVENEAALVGGGPFRLGLGQRLGIRQHVAVHRTRYRIARQIEPLGNPARGEAELGQLAQP